MGALEALQGAVKVGQDGLSVGKWTSPGAQGAAGLVEPAPVPPARDRSLGAAAALIEFTNSRNTTGKASMTAQALGSSSPAALLNPMKTPITITSMKNREEHRQTSVHKSMQPPFANIIK